MYQPEKHSTFIRGGKPVAFVRFDEQTRQRVIYMCHEANDEELEELFSVENNEN